MRFFHGERYDLRAWVVMPNHVHALFKVDATPMAEILESWKKHTAQKANRLLHRRGKFWQADYWDTFMRDSPHELETRHYIENNPAKAGLVFDPKTWPWSSARLRVWCAETLKERGCVAATSRSTGKSCEGFWIVDGHHSLRSCCG